MPILNMIYWATWWGGGWRPWVNTIAYRPLNSTDTVNDMKWTWTAYNLTWTATFWVDEWVDCYQSRSYGTMLTIADSLLYGNSNFTVNYWILEKQTSSSHQHVFLSWWTGKKQQVLMWINWNNNHLMCWKYFEDYDTWYTLTAWNWINVCITYDWSNMKIYVNWNLQLTQSISFWITSSWETSLWDSSLWWNNQYFRWNMSEAILEDKERTAQEIADYYNSTKWDYWIS